MLQKTAKLVSLLSLLALITPSLCFLAGFGNLPQIKWIMLTATIVWFITAPMYMWKNNSNS
ncbi:MAG: hypothetical protein DRP62_02580 [Planctomycetota bacterium]|nr:MAG: hypothetical protein DRP62_02580 [Planctomycetota bacterium]